MCGVSGNSNQNGPMGAGRILGELVKGQEDRHRAAATEKVRHILGLKGRVEFDPGMQGGYNCCVAQMAVLYPSPGPGL